MSAVLLGRVTAERFDVVGTRVEETGVIPHVGLLRSTSELHPGAEVEVLDIGLRRLQIDPPGRFKVAVVGSLALTRDEREGIEEWLAELLPRVRSCTYLALPAARLHRDGESGRIARWEFSCAGFVDTAYKTGAGLALVEQTRLPLIERKDAIAIWAGGRESLFARFSADIGLDGPGPWAVLLPGYILHAMAGGRAGLPYSPAPEDRVFP